jgi:RimJ/RimL family protein N-acetyltransferase
VTAEQPTLADDVVTLRPLRPDDVPDIVLGCRDAETLRWTTIPTPYDEAAARAFIEVSRQGWGSGAGVIWAMTPAGAERWSGAISIGFRAGDPAMAEVGFNCAPWARGQGLTTAAMRLMCAWGFESWPFHDEGLARIQWSAYVGNDASRRVADKVGFVFEGTQRQRLVQRGIRRDAWVGGLLPGDLP